MRPRFDLSPFRYFSRAACAALFAFSLQARGSSGAPLSDLLQQSRQQNLAVSDEWRGLLHFRKRVWGGWHSQVEGDDFFLSPQGRTSAADELNATLEKFFSGPTEMRQKFQCQFLARRDFIVAHLPIRPEDLLPCPAFEEWARTLNPQTLTLVFAAESLGNPASSFGHVFFKIKDPLRDAGQDLLNYGINYAARTEKTSGALYALYGLFGFFPANYGMAPYHHLIKEYTNLEGRDLWEYELDLKPAEILHLIKHLLELEHGYFNYYFLDDNCALMIANALEVARPGLKLHRAGAPWTLPLDVVKKVVAAGLVRQVNYRPSLKATFEHSYEPLRIFEKKRIRELQQKNQSTRANSAAERSETIKSLSTPALEAAQNYFALLGGQDFQAYKDLNYELSLERSQRTDFTPLAMSPPPPPDTGEDSSLVAPSYLSRGSENSFGFRYRAVGHDLLGSDVGAAPFSEFYLGDISIAFQGVERSELSDLVLMRTLASHPVSILEIPLSWQLTIERSPNWQISAGAGLSWDLPIFDGSRWMHFALGKAQEVVNGSHSLGALGYQTLLPVHVSRYWRLLLQESFLWDANHWRDDRQAALAWQIRRDIEARLERSDSTRLSVFLYF